MMQNTSASVSFQHTIYLKTHYNTDYQAIRKEPQNSRICVQGDYNLKQGEFSEGFCKRIFNTYPHPLPKGGGELTCKENHHCAMAFQAIATCWLTTKRAATLTSPQGRGGTNLQGKSSLCYGFPSHSNPLVNNKRAATLTSPQRRGARTCRKIIIVLWLSKP